MSGPAVSVEDVDFDVRSSETMNARVRVLNSITRMIVGGAQLTALQTCRLLDGSRYEPTLMTGPELGPEGDLLTRARTEAFPTVLIPSLGREIRPWRDAVAYRAIRSHIDGGGYSIVHTHTSKAGILTRLAAHRAGVPVILHTAHGWQWTHARGRVMNRIIVRSERAAARYTDRIIVVAEKDREKGLAAGVGRPEQYVHIESAIALDEFDPERVDRRRFRAERRIPFDAPVIGTVGRFAYQKAPEVMLKAALRLLDRRPEVHFVYVGDGPLRSAVLRDLGITTGHPRLHLVGIREDVPSILAAMDVFVLSSRYEGLPRVAVEAMAMGKPVVSTPADGIVDVVVDGKTGLLVPFEGHEELADATLSLIDDRNRMRAMGEEARRTVFPRYDVRSMVKRIENLYEELLAKKTGS